MDETYDLKRPKHTEIGYRRREAITSSLGSNYYIPFCMAHVNYYPKLRPRKYPSIYPFYYLYATPALLLLSLPIYG